VRAGIVLGMVSAIALAGCGGPGDNSTTAGQETTNKTVRLLTHDSFDVSDDVVALFEEESGYTLEIIPVGNAGSLVNQLILTKEDPLGDAVFGIDNTFASRALDQGVLAPLEAAPVPGAEQFAAEGAGRLAPMDYSDVCVNIDREWFAEADLAEPTSLEDLTDPAYKDLLVVENPATSSPGLAFVLATISAFGQDGWLDYWADLAANGVRVVEGWSDAYYVDFSGPSSEGDRPLVVSYASSPPSEVPDGADQAPTASLLDTCFRQVEYAGVLEGASNPEGAAALIDFLGQAAFQTDLPSTMWVYPVNTEAQLPEAWVEYAPLAQNPWPVPAAEISANRDTWIDQWTATVIG
jgi:thiamine transport system substrate-binding protein